MNVKKLRDLCNMLMRHGYEEAIVLSYDPTSEKWEEIKGVTYGKETTEIRFYTNPEDTF